MFVFYKNIIITIIFYISFLWVSEVNAQIDVPALVQSKNVAALLERKTSNDFRQQLRSGQAVEVIVLYKDDAQVRPLQRMASTEKVQRRQQLKLVKDNVMAMMPARDFRKLRDYAELPMNTLNIQSNRAFTQLLADDKVEAVYLNDTLDLHLSQSLPLIQQQPVTDLAVTGEGTTVVVLDTGVDYTQAAFGGCSAPGVPAECRVVAALDIPPDDGALDDNGHGTNVAGIAAGVASGTSIAALDVRNGTAIYISDVIAGIDWAITHQASYNIAAINMSLGGGAFSSPCSSGNPFLVPVATARSLGILVVASSGNDANSHGISVPACTPGVVSVGAVYDSDMGGISWTNCTDNSTASDQITCFSNSDDFLSILAPGALITTAGITLGGTSQAAPHVSGAVALLRSAYSASSADELEQKLVQTETMITDPRNGVLTPRLDLFQALGALNDGFSNPLLLQSTGRVANINASKETGEPDHAGQLGGASLWWTWTATAGYEVCFDTYGSEVDTVLAIYSGTSVSALSEIASNDNASDLLTSFVCFNSIVGQQYMIAVDTVDGAMGIVQLNINNQLNFNVEEDVPIPGWALCVLGALFLRSMAVTKS